MLVAGASLGLMAPLVAQASDVVNLKEIDSYSRSTKKKPSRLDSKSFINKVSDEIVNLNSRDYGIEAKQTEFEAGSFSDTTTYDGKTVFTLGSVDTEDGEDGSSSGYMGEVKGYYTYQANLNTSFSGDDNLYIRLKTGNHDSWADTKSSYNTYLSAAKGGSDSLKVD